MQQEIIENLIAELTKLPGIGRKTAQKIMLKLKGKLKVSIPAGISLEEDITNALVGMGFDRRLAKGAVSAAARSLRNSDLGAEDLERELFKSALAQLTGVSQTSAGAPKAADTSAEESAGGEG